MYREGWSVEKIFFRLLNNKSDKTYWENIQELRSRATQSVFDKSAELIKSPNPKERIIGVHILSQLGFPPRPFYQKTKALFFETLQQERDSTVLCALLNGIHHNNHKLSASDVAFLAKFKDHQDVAIRQALVLGLLGVKHKKAADTLISLSSDKVRSIRDWATFGIGTLTELTNDRIIEALWNRVYDIDQDTRFEAIVGLAKRKDARIKAIIIQELTRGSFGTLLFEAIELLNDQDFLPLLKQHVVSNQNAEQVSTIWLSELEELIKKLEQ